MTIANSVLELVGRTPMVRLNRMATDSGAEVVVKLEAHNPAGSVKDRVSLAMIEAAERQGKIAPGDTLVEPTSGNTGVGLAFVAAVKGYRLVVTLPDDTPQERRRLLEHYGATLVLTPARKLMKGAVERAEQIVQETPRAFMPQQFANIANVEAHQAATALEILHDTEGHLDAFVAGIGTGGTLMGVSKVLKQRLPAARMIAVEPDTSQVLAKRSPSPHAIFGIGAGFVPPIVDRALIDEVWPCTERNAYDTAVRLAREEGISAGVSGGAAVWVAVQVAKKLDSSTRVVTVVPDGWERYLSVERPGLAVRGLDFII